MTAIASRGSPDRVFPICVTLTMKDQQKLKSIARGQNKSFAEYARAILVAHLRQQEQEHAQ